ncbi:hypothetical protein PISMIDRAFT_7794 [Pisolithus microcarpus 441]|uniref:DUF6534 domain-containing protein n=1 Tax=Pisolithus microcarpus 441 TaxID=765257 RepID=A0A0D0A1K7_9AGAM|nr:hypothetical protein PISMIDRAFT_7794 [Pisolithus microcarpus 441]
MFRLAFYLLVIQTYIYYMHYSNDTSIVKFLVAAICFLDTLHVAFIVLLSGETEAPTPCNRRTQLLQIINYGVPASVEYIVWSFPASVIPNLLVILIVQLFSDNNTSILTQTWYYSVTPSAAIVVVAEVVITVSLCVLLYDGGSHSSFPRTKRLVNTLITYAVNRCLLSLLVVIGVLTVNVNQLPAWTMGLDFIVGKIYANSLLASLNTREYLWFRGSAVVSNPNLSVIRFANPPAPLGDAGRSKDGGKRFDMRGVALVDTSTKTASGTTTTLETDVEV